MHPNHPDALPLGELISAEADAILAECTDSTFAQDFADNWEALMEDRGIIISTAARSFDLYPDLDRAAMETGYVVWHLIRMAAEKRARHELSMREAA